MMFLDIGSQKLDRDLDCGAVPDMGQRGDEARGWAQAGGAANKNSEPERWGVQARWEQETKPLGPDAALFYVKCLAPGWMQVKSLYW